MTPNRSPFTEITAFEPPEHTGLQEELIPLRYAAYRCPTLCLNCGERSTESKLFLVLGHTRRVDVAKMTIVNRFAMNLPITTHDLALREIPACFMCYDDTRGHEAPDLSMFPAPAEHAAWQDAVARAVERDAKATARAEGKPATTTKPKPTIDDI